MPRQVAPGWLTERPYAHRGLHGDGVPENSLAAITAARDAGYAVELDVHLTRDGVPVVAHDPVLTRMTGVDARVARSTLAQLRQLRLDGTDERVPTLEEALDVLGDTPVMVEVKSLRLAAGRLEPAVAAVLEAASASSDAPAPRCVASFNPATLRWFRRHRPDVVRVLTSRPADRFAGLPGAVARRLGRLADLDAVAPAAVSYELEGLPAPPVDGWREAGGTVVTWTVRTTADLDRALHLADAVIFEHVRP